VDAVHDRMPVVMPPESWDAWLDEKTAGAGKLVEAATATAGELTAMAVSKWVNDPKHDDARCVEKSEGPAQGQLF
jgi:putative SOS response-associated peptidase YedK